MCWVVQTKLFSSPNTDLVICAKFQAILWEFANSKKFRQIQECGKKLEPQVHSQNLSRLYHQCLKLSFFIKRQ